MSEQIPDQSDPISLVLVGESIIEQFELESHNIGEMYQELFESNPNLALYLRRRASEVSPDLTNREVQSKLALEIATLLAKQQGVSGLEKMFELELLNDEKVMGQTDPQLPPAA